MKGLVHRMEEYLSIGELANIFGMDVQLLRYYDARGILVPSVRNEANGRRYYHFDQVYPLATIRYLRKLDYSLDQIGAFISSGDISQNLGSMAEQAGLLQQRCEELLATVTVLQKKIRFIQEESACAEEGTFRIKTYPERPLSPNRRGDRPVHLRAALLLPDRRLLHPIAKAFRRLSLW